MVRIRPSIQADMAAIDALLARSYPRLLKDDYPPSTLVLALPIISRARPDLVVSGTYYVAEDATGAILGAGGWTPSRRRPGWGNVRHVVTDHTALRRGVGRAIMQHAFDEASAAGMRVLDCWSTRMAVPFYSALGFVPLGPIEVPLDRGITFPAIQMYKRL